MSIGVHGRRGRRNVPTLVNRAYGESFFWDGRMSTLALTENAGKEIRVLLGEISSFCIIELPLSITYM